ncbi:hypothetical protein GW17_00046833 [Ensete ventricosum]|nr:hypothetical protein GW17_00046833 [Ensete ventricosum]
MIRIQWGCVVDRSTEAVRRRRHRGSADPADPRRQRRKGAAREADHEGRAEALQPRLPLRRRLHHFLDPLRPEADLLVPRHPVLLRPGHLLLQRGNPSHLLPSMLPSPAASPSSRCLRGCVHGQVSVLEMDGQFDRLDELIYVESHLSNLSTKFYGEVTQQMLKHADFPGSNNGTGLFQTIIGLKIRDLYEQIVAERAAAAVEAAKV